MTADILQFLIYGTLLLLLAYPLGLYMARLFSGERTWLTPALSPVERQLYRACGVDGEILVADHHVVAMPRRAQSTSG